MWLSKALANSLAQNFGNKTITAIVADNAKDGFIINDGIGELRSIPAITPFGYNCSAPSSEPVIITPFEESAAIIGTIAKNSTALRQGEIEIRASSGAYIKLCDNGDVLLNGVSFPPFAP